MGQSVGGQIFGPWYDIIGWIIAAGVFFYFAISAESMPSQIKEKFPAFLLNKRLCASLGLLMAFLGIGKALDWW